MRNASDTAWKDLLDIYLKDFLDYCLPDLSQLIDWNKKWVSLDKELQVIAKGESNKCLADKLFKVFLHNGQEQWVLIHIEVQGEVDSGFPKRMFSYGYRIYDLYQVPIASCAILTDSNKKWRPQYFEVGLAGSYLSCKFLLVKIIDYQNKLEELETSKDLFANVIYAQLMALASKNNPQRQRKNIKFILTKRLYDKKFSKNEIRNLYCFIDWLIGLPEDLAIEYDLSVHELEESQKMPYISRIERVGMERGLQQGMELGAKETNKKNAIKMYQAGIDSELIQQVTGIDVEELAF